LAKGVEIDRFRVKSGKEFVLDSWDPNDTTGFDGSEDEAKEEAKKLEQKLDGLQEMLYAEHKHKLLIVLQAMDTGGKDGVIRRVFQGVNPAGVRVAHFREPSTEEADHDFLWRIHREVPGTGELVIFNRSHYEGVLVERVHGLVAKEVWERRYKEINEFEKSLSQEGTTILKFYLHIDKDEQKKRIKQRLEDPTKEWKFSADDLSERKLWLEYMDAYEDTLENTSTDFAPWFIIPANHKWFRDLVVSSVLAKSLESLSMKYPKLTEGERAKASDL
jgi:PPK2 family polyphosphate:nucleotide phosphotransferase